MITVVSVEFQRNFGRYRYTAINEPVKSRERIAVLFSGEYQRLKRRDCQAIGLDDCSDAGAEQ
jgi:hypothetical protein